MALSKIVVIYSKSQNKRRRVVVSDSDDSDYDPHIQCMQLGEAVWMMPIEQYAQAASIADDCERAAFIDNALAEYTGKSALSDRCVVVCPEGNVLHALCADPLIDKHPAGDIVQHHCAVPGWKCLNNIWIEPASIATAPVEDVVFFPDSLTTTARSGLFGTDWYIQCVGDMLSIGCETHSIVEWAAFKDSRIILMDTPALAWWMENKPAIMAFTDEHLQRCSEVCA